MVPEHAQAYQNRNHMMREWVANQTSGAHYIDFDVLSTSDGIPGACTGGNKHYACHLRYTYKDGNTTDSHFRDPFMQARPPATNRFPPNLPTSSVTCYFYLTVCCALFACLAAFTSQQFFCNFSAQPSACTTEVCGCGGPSKFSIASIGVLLSFCPPPSSPFLHVGMALLRSVLCR